MLRGLGALKPLGGVDELGFAEVGCEVEDGFASGHNSSVAGLTEHL